MSSRVLAVLLAIGVAGVAGFIAGQATPRPTAPLLPVAESAEILAVPAHAEGLGACKNELFNIKAQLAICVAYRAPTDSSPPTPPPRPPVEMDDETARLVRTGTTNTSTVLVQTECGTRFYAAGTWPPPGGPPSTGSRITARGVDGGMEFYAADGGVRFVASSNRPLVCPCPRDTVDGGP